MMACTHVFRSRILPFAVLGLLMLPALAAAQPREPRLDPEGELKRLEEIHRSGMESDANRRSGEDVLGRDEWWSFVRRFPYDMLPADQRLNAIRDVQQQKQRLDQAVGLKHSGAKPMAANVWSSIGPYNISGRTRSIAILPGDAQTAYIGAAAGGVWKTTNAGTTWSTTTDTLSSLAANALAIDRNNPHIVYLGTGENTINVDAYRGTGMFKSTDAGRTWKNIGLANVTQISKIYVNRQNSQVVYVAAGNGGGFWRSEDAGATWKQTLPGVTLYDMAVDPANGNQVYVGTTNSVRRSTDGGKTWTGALPGITSSSGIRVSVGLAASQPSRLYALIARNGGAGGTHIAEAYASTDGGSSWQLKQTFDQFFFNQQGWYDNCIAVDPFDPNNVLVGGIDVYRSVNGGTSWTNVTRSYTDGTTHPDQHVLVYDESTPSVVYLGNDGGVYTSIDGGGTWQKASLSLPTSQFYAMDVDQTRSYRVYGGTQDNGSHGSQGTNDYPQNWQRVLNGDGFYVVVDQGDPNVIYAENFNGTPMYRIDANNPGNRIRIDASISPNANTGDVGAWVTPIASSPVDKKLYTGRSNLWFSTNRGSTWDTAYKASGSSVKIVSIGLSPFDAKKIAISRTNGEVLFTLDGGNVWTKSKGLPSTVVADVEYCPVVPNRLYATISGTSGGRVYRSDDNGANFTSITGPSGSSGTPGRLPAISTNAIAIDPRDSSHLFVGTDIGVFMSLDGGQFWFPFDDGLALSPVVDLKIHKTTHTLIAATHGRSMFRVNITGLVAPPLLITPSGGETFLTPAKIPVRWTGFAGAVKILISYDGGRTWQELNANASNGLDTLDIPLMRSTVARVRVVEASSGRTLESRNFTLSAASNCTDLGKKGFQAEAIEYRRNAIWAAVAGKDSIYKLTLPQLTGRVGLVRTNIPGRVRDMAYDEANDRFYVLVTDADYGNPKVYRMDTNGVGGGQVPLPADITHASGVAAAFAGVALMTPGAAGNVRIVSDNGDPIRTVGPISGTALEDRRGLVWDLLGFVQAVVHGDSTIPFPSLLQHLSGVSPLVLNQSTTLVPPADRRFEFTGIAFDPSNSDINKRTYVVTDTAGTFCRCDREKFFTSGVEEGGAVPGFTAHDVAVTAISPNPVREMADVSFAMHRSGRGTVEIYDATGLRVAVPFVGLLEQGTHTMRLDAAGFASGIYYVSITLDGGDRAVRPMVVVK